MENCLFDCVERFHCLRYAFDHDNCNGCPYYKVCEFCEYTYRYPDCEVTDDEE